MMKKRRRSSLKSIVSLLSLMIIVSYFAYFYLYLQQNDNNAHDKMELSEAAPRQQKQAQEAVNCRDRVKRVSEGAPDAGESSADTSSTIDFTQLELPYRESDEFVIRNTAGRYTIMYDTLYRQAAWVAYLLTKADLESKSSERRNKFIPDPEVVKRGYPTAKTSHYTNSGYDRGHLCPSADRDGSQRENDNTFLLSNISPQSPSLNRKLWKKLEEQVRSWAGSFDSLYVVTGGVLSPGLKTIKNGIGVPEYFYKVILTRYRGEFHAVAFVMPNSEQCAGALHDYAVSVDSVEVLTSYDFYHSLPDNIETAAESSYSATFWFGQ